MNEVIGELLTWVDDGPGPEKDERITTLRLAIGMAFIAKYARLNRELELTKQSLGHLGLSGLIETEVEDKKEVTEEVFINRDQLTEFSVTTLAGNKILVSRLWDRLWRQHTKYTTTALLLHDQFATETEKKQNTRWLSANAHWSGIFNDDGELSINQLAYLVNNDLLHTLDRIGVNSLALASTIVDQTLNKDTKINYALAEKL